MFKSMALSPYLKHFKSAFCYRLSDQIQTDTEATELHVRCAQDQTGGYHGPFWS